MRVDQIERAIQTRIFQRQHREINGEVYRSGQSGLLEVYTVDYLPPLPFIDLFTPIVRHLKNELRTAFAEELTAAFEDDDRFYIIYCDVYGVLTDENDEEHTVKYTSDSWYRKTRGSDINKEAIQHLIIKSICDKIRDPILSGTLRLTRSNIHKRTPSLPPQH